MNGSKRPSGTLAALAKPSQAQIREALIDLVRKDLKGPAVGDEELELWGQNAQQMRNRLLCPTISVRYDA